jgi:hypothetical protein
MQDFYYIFQFIASNFASSMPNGIDRDLLQSRGIWRALLPQAIADRLAKSALKTIPKNNLVQAFLNRGSKRLIKSFTRRLGYLHDSSEAVSIVNGWLSPDGWIAWERELQFQFFRHGDV